MYLDRVTAQFRPSPLEGHLNLSRFEVAQIKLLQALVNMFLCEPASSFLWMKAQDNCCVIWYLCVPFQETVKLFSHINVPFYISFSDIGVILGFGFAVI